MGQNTSLLSDNVDDFTNPLVKLAGDDSVKSFVFDNIITMSYEEFINKLGELNKLSATCLDSTGNKLIFAVKKGSDTSIFWKATVQIACVKVDPVINKVHSYRLINLKEFLQIAETLQNHYKIAEESKKSAEDKSNASVLEENITESLKANNLELQNACCICFERKPDVLLPCTHVYCEKCIDEWNQGHHNCPICRKSLDSTDESWVISEVPEADEISEEIKNTLMSLAGDTQKNGCKTS